MAVTTEPLHRHSLATDAQPAISGEHLLLYIDIKLGTVPSFVAICTTDRLCGLLMQLDDDYDAGVDGRSGKVGTFLRSGILSTLSRMKVFPTMHITQADTKSRTFRNTAHTLDFWCFLSLLFDGFVHHPPPERPYRAKPNSTTTNNQRWEATDSFSYHHNTWNEKAMIRRAH